jgi:hypothetical protein
MCTASAVEANKKCPEIGRVDIAAALLQSQEFAKKSAVC